MIERKSFGPLVVAIITVELLVMLWAGYRVDDILWQVRRADTLRSEVVTKKRQLAASGKLNLSPEAQKQFSALLNLLESDEQYERELIASRVEWSRRQFYIACGVFGLQLVLSVFILLRKPRRGSPDRTHRPSVIPGIGR